MQMYDRAAEQLRGPEGDFNMQGRTFAVMLLPAKESKFEREQKTADEVLKSQDDDSLSLEDGRVFTLDADVRVKYNEPNQRQILFLIQNRSDSREEVLNHNGGGLLFETEPEEPAAVGGEDAPKKKSRKKGTKNGVVALVSKADLIPMISGEGLVVTVPS